MGNLNFNIKAIFFDILRKSWIIVLAFIVGLLGNYFLVESRRVPTYTSNAKLFIAATTDFNASSASEQMDLSTYYYSVNISNAKQLIGLLTIVLPEDLTTDYIMDRLDAIDGTPDHSFIGAAGATYSQQAVGSMIRLSQVQDNVVMQITVSTPCEQDSIDIANAVCDAMPDILENIVGRGKVTPLQMAQSATVSNTPSYRQPILFGLAAALAVVIVIVLINLFDTSIHGKDEIVSTYNVTVLGEIPHFSANTKTGKGYTYARKK